MSIYALTLILAIHNIIVFLVKQKRYKRWLIAIFYVISVGVLTARLIFYGYDVNLFY